MKKIIIYTLHNQIAGQRLLFDLAKANLNYSRRSYQDPADFLPGCTSKNFPITRILDSKGTCLYDCRGYWPGLVKRIEKEAADENS